MQGMFRANGGCGYVKKPEVLLKDGLPPNVFDPNEPSQIQTHLKVDGLNTTYRTNPKYYFLKNIYIMQLNLQVFFPYRLKSTMVKAGIWILPTLLLIHVLLQISL